MRGDSHADVRELAHLAAGEQRNGGSLAADTDTRPLPAENFLSANC